MPRVPVKAVLGPTNTGKTHLAIERLCAHSSGMMGLPLRLLAREVYDRVRAVKGDASVALITGEEKILPPAAKWLICTVESMPVDRDVAFVAIDEAQLGADPERGHVFTDRILSARGREETMILGSATLAPLLRTLVPEAEIIGRPRFSNLAFAGAKKLSRLPPRSAIVAFSAEEVYGIAELIRRTRGGAAVVMGALSPRTRNAQVAMFESGEVDYLVATDAIGMGLNLDLGHVAFASLSKFDGKRQRRLSVVEMAQIAGRAGRHQRDGSFGVLAGTAHAPEFSDAEIDRIENHRFPPLDHLNWRESDPDFSSVGALIASLEAFPEQAALRPAPEAIDLAVLKRLGDEPVVQELAASPRAVSRLWEVCGLPDFRHLGSEFHARQVSTIFQYLARDSCHIPADAAARELAHLDSVQGDIDALTARIAAVRTWAYASQRPDWLLDPAHWAERARALEQRLSDALHDRLTQRFVDRRTTLLVRGMRRDAADLDVRFGADGAITVEDEPLGRLDGFELRIDASARLDERKRMTAAVERSLPAEVERRTRELLGAPDHEFRLVTVAGASPSLHWREAPLGDLKRGRSLLSPAIVLTGSVSRLPADLKRQIGARLTRWQDARAAALLRPLATLQSLAESPESPPALRAICANLLDSGGIRDRSSIPEMLESLPENARKELRGAGIVVGALDLFHPGLLKPEAARFRTAFLAAHREESMPALPAPGTSVLTSPAPHVAAGAMAAGWRRFDQQLVRIDLVQRIARALHDQRGKKPSFTLDLRLAAGFGISDRTTQHILNALGFYRASGAGPELWKWRNKSRRRWSRAEPRITNSLEALQSWAEGRVP